MRLFQGWLPGPLVVPSEMARSPGDGHLGNCEDKSRTECPFLVYVNNLTPLLRSDCKKVGGEVCSM